MKSSFHDHHIAELNQIKNSRTLIFYIWNEIVIVWAEIILVYYVDWDLEFYDKLYHLLF